MIWRGGECQISEGLTALIDYGYGDGLWFAAIDCADSRVWISGPLPNESAAKAAVCHWIGKTMAQFSNALAAGCNDVDDGN